MEVKFPGAKDIELSDCSLLPKSCQPSDAPDIGNKAGGTIEQQHSIIDIVTDPSTGNGVTENGDMGSSADNLGGGSVIEGKARFFAMFLSLFLPQCGNNTGEVVDDATAIFSGNGNVGGGSGISRVWTWLMRKLVAIWLLLGIRQMNPFKTGSFALGLVTFFVDKHLSHEDVIYLKVALWCGVLAFFIAPWSVPDGNAPLIAQARQAFAVLTLVIGVLVAIVTAVDEKKFRWLVLSFFALLFIICLCVEEEVEEEDGDGGGGGGGVS